MKISIASYSFHGLRSEGMIDVFGYLETCRYRYRLNTADFWNGLLGADEIVWDPLFQRKVVRALREREMTLVNYHVDGCHIWEDDPDRREVHHRAALAHLRAAATLGAKTVRIDAGGRGQEWTSEQFDLLVTRYREYCCIAADCGFRIGPESHWGPELVPDNMERLARAVDHPAFGILLHVGHWEQATPEEGDRRLAPWAVHTHVDARTTRMRLAEAIQILLSAGYDGYWGVEHHSGRNEYAEVAVQLAEVQRVLLELAPDKSC